MCFTKKKKKNSIQKIIIYTLSRDQCIAQILSIYTFKKGPKLAAHTHSLKRATINDVIPNERGEQRWKLGVIFKLHPGWQGREGGGQKIRKLKGRHVWMPLWYVSGLQGRNYWHYWPIRLWLCYYFVTDPMHINQIHWYRSISLIESTVGDHPYIT